MMKLSTNERSNTQSRQRPIANSKPPVPSEVIDVAGVGFGPSNLALAVCARELDPRRSCLFFEQNDRFLWHPGMLFDGARMQISFLKDLVSMRNLASPYTFLQYTKAHGRLEQFINMSQFRPTRVEYQDYLSWVASHFSEQVRYGTRVMRVAPALDKGEAKLFRIELEDIAGGQPWSVLARNVVCATGGRPRLPSPEFALPSVIHSSQFRQRFPVRFADVERAYVFGVAGGGQSAGEIAAYLLDRYERCEVHLFISSFALRPTDNSPFVNEQFYSHASDEFYGFDDGKRAALLHELRNANYGVVREDLLDHLYDVAYRDAVLGRQRLIFHRYSKLTGVREEGERLVAVAADRFGGATESLTCDGIVLATGYDRSLDQRIFGSLAAHLATDEAGGLVVSPSHRVSTRPELQGGLYVQGYSEARFGLGDTLLSMLPFRSRAIFEDICARAPATAPSPEAPRPAAPGLWLPRIEYPPRQYVETDGEKLYAAMERFRFATVISSRGVDDPVVTQVPLTLDRSRGAKGVLFGHMDRANPHVELLDGRRVLALFHGPNAYISPKVSSSDQLPTWNSITVRVRGKVTTLMQRADLIRGLCGIAAQSEEGGRLNPDDPRIDKLINFIVGFEIEIEEMVGRFKLSQDKAEPDRRAAAVALVEKTEAGDRKFVEYALGLPLRERGPR